MTKKKLFTNYIKEGTIVSINLDDPYGMKLYEEVKNKIFHLVTFKY